MRLFSTIIGRMRPHIAFLGLCLGQILLLNIFYIGPAFNDDYQYIEYAADILRDHALSLAPMAVRNILVLPLAASFAVFGIGDIAVRLTMTAFNLVAIAVVYALGSLCFNKSTAIVACGLFIFFPLVFQYATQVGADIPAAAALGFALWLLMKGGLFASASTPRRNARYLLAGLFIGVAYSGKTTAVLFLIVPFCEAMWFLVSKRRFPWWGLWCLLGAFSFWVAEGLVYWMAAGDFLHHYHAEREYYNNPNFLMYVRNPDLRMYPRLMFLLQQWRGTYAYGLSFYMVLPGLIWCLTKARRRSLGLVIWLLIMWLYHQFGSMSLTEYIRVDRQSRYLSILVIPLVLIGASWMSAWLQSGSMWRRFIGGTALVITLGVGIIQSGHAYIHDRGGVEDVIGIHDVVREYGPSRPVYCDNGLIPRLQFREGYLNATRQYRGLNEALECESINGRLIVVDSLRYLGEPDWRFRFRDCLEGLEPSAVVSIPWQIGMFREYDPAIYSLAHDSSSNSLLGPEIVRIPASGFTDKVNCYYDDSTYGSTQCGLILPGAMEGQSAASDFVLPLDREYDLYVRYASADPRPVRILIDGSVVREQGLNDVSTGWHVKDLILVRQKRLRMDMGGHRIAFEADHGQFIPHIAEVLIVPIESPGALRADKEGPHEK